MATQVIQGLTQSQIEYLREMSRHKQEADYWQELRDAKDEGEARGIAKGREEGRAEGRAEGEAKGQKKLIALLESGKTLAEAKQLLGL
jgi:predicted transposase YdaD